MPTSLPDWQTPSNLKVLMEGEDLTWESDRWSPIQLSVIGGTSYMGRDIDQSWQIEYEPDECDGYEILDRVLAAGNENDPDIRPDLHCDDTEEAALVIWTESEDVCRRLMALVWPINAGSCCIIFLLANVFRFDQGRRRPHNPLCELIDGPVSL